MPNEFSATFNHLLALSGKSLTKVAELSGLDRAYLLRLSRGERTNPSNEAIVRLFIALVFDERMVKADPTVTQGLEELLLAAAFTSASIGRVGAVRLPA
jgi:transcriptional regulator with XRE-family HTH domain